VNFTWERLADKVFRTRLPFLDVTVGVVCGSTGTLLVDTGTTLGEAAAIVADVGELAATPITHILLTHNDFDHILGIGGHPGAEVFSTDRVVATLLHESAQLRDEALSYDADPQEIDAAIAARRIPDHAVRQAVVGLGDRTVSIVHPGRGHTDHDLIAVVRGAERPVVFCGDLVEESGEPSVEADSDPGSWPATLDRLLRIGGPDAVYVPGHGATVDAAFVQRQRQWLAERV
jgi:glyoxylase-like metal-dependent hydrolase (beta-lactamase superfamily II)